MEFHAAASASGPDLKAAIVLRPGVRTIFVDKLDMEDAPPDGFHIDLPGIGFVSEIDMSITRKADAVHHPALYTLLAVDQPRDPASRCGAEPHFSEVRNLRDPLISVERLGLQVLIDERYEPPAAARYQRLGAGNCIFLVVRRNQGRFALPL